MAVPSSARRTSGMQYIETARVLAREILGFANRLPKRLARRISDPLFDHAREALYHLQTANRVYVVSDADYNQRRAHLLEAIGHIDHVATLLDICYEIQRTDPAVKDPNDNVYMQFAEMIDRERQLIGGVLRKDQRARR